MPDFKPGDAWETASGLIRIVSIGPMFMEVDVYDPVPPEDGQPRVLRVPFTNDGKCLVSWDGYEVDFTPLRKFEDAPSESASV